jgi:hypothetical protein
MIHNDATTLWEVRYRQPFGSATGTRGTHQPGCETHLPESPAAAASIGVVLPRDLHERETRGNQQVDSKVRDTEPADKHPHALLKNITAMFFSAGSAPGTIRPEGRSM